jgi:inner membrane protein
MPNFKTHALVGASVGMGLNIAKQWTQKAADPTRKFNWGEVFVWGGIGLTVASLPDLLEPAAHPNHRSTFHSLAVLAVILYAVHGKHSKEFSPDQRRGAGLLGYPYISHLALDFLTKAGLPFI